MFCRRFQPLGLCGKLLVARRILFLKGVCGADEAVEFAFEIDGAGEDAAVDGGILLGTLPLARLTLPEYNCRCKRPGLDCQGL